MTIAIGVMARAPSSGGKSRLGAHVDEQHLGALRAAFVKDTLDVVCACPHADVTVFATPPGTASEMRALAPQSVPVIDQRGGDLGERMRHALDYLLVEKRYGAAILVGTDAPLMTIEHIDEAAALLRTRGGVVLGPADDGGYYLIGMTRVSDALFTGIRWGSDAVLIDTMAAADRIGVDACLIRGTYDVDTIEDLRRMRRDLAAEPPEVARSVRAVVERMALE